MDCSPPGPSIHGIFQARVLEWGAIAFSTKICIETHTQKKTWKVTTLRKNKIKKWAEDLTRHGEQYKDSSKIELQYNRVILVLCLYLMEMKTLIQKIYLPHVHWSIIYNSQDMIGEWIKKMGCVCVRVCVCVCVCGILLSQEKESNLTICVNMVDLKSIMLSKISQTKKTNIVRFHLCIIYKTNVTKQK